MSTRERELEVKLAKETEYRIIAEKRVSSLLKQCREERKKTKSVIDSRSALQLKLKRLRGQFKKHNRKNALFAFGGGEAIARHKYDVATVKLCLNAYLLSGCSFRGVVRVLEYLRFSGGLDIAEVPCKSSIENWLKKCGHYIYGHPDVSVYSSGYALIIDECLVIGQERMLVILAIKANKEDGTALCRSDAQVLWMEVQRSWTGEQITERIGKVEVKVGTKATYIISDRGSNLVKGIGGGAAPRIADCGHEVARQMEGLYKGDARFCAFVLACAQSKLKLVMMPTGYLAAPRQRTIARFMNLWPLLKWATCMLRNIGSLEGEDSVAYAWVNDHREIIEELTMALGTANELLKLLKDNGLSHGTVGKCTQICNTFVKTAVGLSGLWMEAIIGFVKSEGTKLPDNTTVWHMSSDIIESLFGSYKVHKADNGLYGVTPLVLSLPVLTKINAEAKVVKIDFKVALEGTLMDELANWNAIHLVENQVVKRRKILKM